jgi:formiminotetrahydrofolate cyclodeaminase
MTPMMTLAPSATQFVFDRCRQVWQAATKKAAPAPRSIAEELADVRALADSYRKSDPGFASDLYAAADRHERASEVAATI